MQTKQAKPAIAGLVSAESDSSLCFREARKGFERAYFANLLQMTSGNISEAARLSGLARQNFYAHIKRLAIVTES